jgi:DNA/RNA-binding domain of Phe-tRNA-synthetase-like protein
MDTVIGTNWQNAQTGACVGLLCMVQVENPPSHAALQALKEKIEIELRDRFSGLDRVALRAKPIMAAYDRFYRQFKKTYHLQLQLESVLSGKPIPSVAALVEAMFMAELEDQLLTAGHDLDTLQPPLLIDISDGTQTYIRMNGQQQTLKLGDLFIQDEAGVLSSVIYGPDKRTQIQAETRNILFTTYGVPGIAGEDVLSHLEKLRDYVHLIAPQAEVTQLEVLGS